MWTPEEELKKIQEKDYNMSSPEYMMGYKLVELEEREKELNDISKSIYIKNKIVEFLKNMKDVEKGCKEYFSKYNLASTESQWLIDEAKEKANWRENISDKIFISFLEEKYNCHFDTKKYEIINEIKTLINMLKNK